MLCLAIPFFMLGRHSAVGLVSVEMEFVMDSPRFLSVCAIILALQSVVLTAGSFFVSFMSNRYLFRLRP